MKFFRNPHFILLLLAAAFSMVAVLSGNSYSQDSLPAKKLYFNFNSHYGFIIAHHQNMDYLIKKHIGAAELDCILQTNGEKKWQRVYKNPEIGMELFYAGLGNPQQLGDAMGIAPFINLPLNPGRKFKLYVKICDGLGYVTKPYNRIDNHKNNINGSRLNALINLKLNSVFYPGKNLRMEVGVGLTHLSNGAWTAPNLGANIATMNIGIGFRKSELKAKKKEEKNKKQPSEFKKYFFTIVAAVGPTESFPPDGRRFPDYSLSMNVWKITSEKSRFCLGADFFYDLLNLDAAKRDTVFDTSKKLNNVQAGLHFGYELVIGKIALPLEMGAYLFSKTTVDGPFYHRIGIRYYVSKHFIINYTLQTHWATAANIEFGVGYRF